MQAARECCTGFSSLFESKTTKVCIIGIVAGGILLTISGLALSGLLLPHSSIGLFIMGFAGFKGSIAFVSLGYISGFAAIGSSLLKLYLNHRKDLDTDPSEIIDPTSQTIIDEQIIIGEYSINYGFIEDSNINCREYMEDRTVVLPNFDNNRAFFAVYDGHGGDATAEFLKTHFHETFKLQLAMPPDPMDAMKETYKVLDEQLITRVPGSTAATVLIDGKQVYVANVGDTRVVLCENGKAKRLTVDHKASDPNEQKRIKDKGGWIDKNMVGGLIAVSRAFGDIQVEGWVKAEPDTATFTLADETQFLIIASDGLWDVVQDQEAVDLIKDETDTQEMARKLSRTAIEKGTKDNVSIIVVAFNKS